MTCLIWIMFWGGVCINCAVLYVNCSSEWTGAELCACMVLLTSSFTVYVDTKNKGEDYTHPIRIDMWNPICGIPCLYPWGIGSTLRGCPTVRPKCAFRNQLI